MARPSALEQHIAQRIKFPRRLEAMALWTMVLGGFLGAGGAAVALLNGVSMPSHALLLIVTPMLVLGTVLSMNKLVQNYRHEPEEVPPSRFRNIDVMDSPAQRRRARTFFLSTAAGLVITGASAATLFSLSSSLALSVPGLLLCTSLTLVGCMVMPWVLTRPAYSTNKHDLKFRVHEHVLAKIDAQQTLDGMERAHMQRHHFELALMHHPKGYHGILHHPEVHRLTDEARASFLPVIVANTPARKAEGRGATSIQALWDAVASPCSSSSLLHSTDQGNGMSDPEMPAASANKVGGEVVDQPRATPST